MIRFILIIGLFAALAPMVKAAELLGHWNFDEGSGAISKDQSGNGCDGKIHGAPKRVPGVAGEALRFASNEDFVDFGRPVIPERDFTISLWVNCDDVEKQFFLGQYRYAHPQRLDLAIREGCVRIQIDELLDSPKRVQPGRWHHLAYTRAGDAVMVYLDGQVINAGVLPAAVIQTENLILGKIVVPGQDSFRFTGMLDELKIWDAALPATAVLAEYQSILPPESGS
ncbi:LamG domain-containing protein [Prosthecobacter sp. SYSU 5D2]|uniref:LamG domain-containing protein n=1 Tax=Prosthecobacter sp. SYSU 5D2 TaxID=3134134 RepID=UPI0031FF4039